MGASLGQELKKQLVIIVDATVRTAVATRCYRIHFSHIEHFSGALWGDHIMKVMRCSLVHDL